MRQKAATELISLLRASAIAVAFLVAALAHPSTAFAAVMYTSGCGEGDENLFNTGSLVHFIDDPRPAIVFDQSLMPADDTTPYKENWESAHLRITRPYDKSSFPVNIAPPRVRWEDETDNLWMVSFAAPGWESPLCVVTKEKCWVPSASTWQALKKAAGTSPVHLEVRGCRTADGKRVGTSVYTDEVTFSISKYPVDPVIVYRLVTPLFHSAKTPDMFYLNIASLDGGLFYPSVGDYCTNCHSFANTPSTLEKDYNLAIAIRHRDGDKRLTVLGIYNFLAREGRGIAASSFFMSWNPDGTKLAVCEGKDTYSKPLTTLETQEFLVRMADIHIVDRITGEDFPLPGASSRDYMETFPAWSADGKTILFTRAAEIGDNWHPIKFDIFQVPYNDGKGGESTPLPGASENGMSNYFPRFSPDGKWMVWTRAEWSSLVAPTSDIWIMSARDWSNPRKLECNYDCAMDSHHSWSSNSRWLLFTTKRDDGIFARMYLTEIDEEGHASPPIEVPTPGGDEVMCYNVPEFMKFDMPIDARDILNQTGHVTQPR
jgi:hypothetical protein